MSTFSSGFSGWGVGLVSSGFGVSGWGVGLVSSGFGVSGWGVGLVSSDFGATGSSGWVKDCPSLPVSWVPLTATGFGASGLFGLTSIGWGLTASLVPTAIILSTGCLVIVDLITLLADLPSTVVTSLNTICSPLIPSWTTLVCPLGKVASGCSTVLKGTASVVDFSSGLFSTNVLGAGVGSGWGCVGSTIGCVCFGRTFCSPWGDTLKSLRVK